MLTFRICIKGNLGSDRYVPCNLLSTQTPFTYSICPRHPEYDGKSSSGRLLICSMGISPSPLLCGPTANYGSIIAPCVCHCQHRLQFGFCRIGFIAHFYQKVVAHLQSRLSTQVMYLMNGYSVVKVLRRHYWRPHYTDKKEVNYKVFEKSFLYIF